MSLLGKTIAATILLALVPVNCGAPTTFMQYRACLRDEHGYLRTGTVMEETVVQHDVHLILFQADEDPRDGKHLRWVRRNSVIRGCRLASGLPSAERSGPDGDIR